MNKFLASKLLLVVLALVVAVNGYAQTCPGSPGCLDPTFGVGGMVLTSPPAAMINNNVARDMVIQSDGKIVVLAGAKDTDNTFSGVLVRFTADGSIDAAFGSGGFAYLAWGTPNYCLPQKLAIQIVSGEERFVVVGAGGCGVAPNVRVERFTNWGVQDSTFGSGGFTTVNAVWNPNDFSIAIQSDQKILLAGGANPMVRLKANGTADTTFGPNGISTTNAGVTIKKIHALSNGKIIAAGYASNGSNYDFAAVRFNSNSKLDTTFGTSGKTLVDFASRNDVAFGMVVDLAGKVLVVGGAGHPDNLPAGSYRGALVRLKSDGKIDTTFGTGGKSAPLSSSTSFGSVSVQANGKLVLTGSTVTGDDILTARFKSNGTIDTTYHGDGWNISDIYGFDDIATKGQIRVDPSCNCERLVVAGYTLTEPYTGLYMNPRYILGIRYTL